MRDYESKTSVGGMTLLTCLIIVIVGWLLAYLFIGVIPETLLGYV